MNQNKKRMIIGIVIALALLIVISAVGMSAAPETTNMKSMGIMVGILIVALVLVITKTNDNVKAEFDERQEAVRGKAFKYGFFTLIIYNALAVFADGIGILNKIAQYSVVSFLGILIAVIVMATISIMNDAYFSLNENKGKLLIIFALIGFVNIVVAIMNMISGKLLENGVLTFESMNLFCGIMFVYIFVVMLVKNAKDKREEAE